MDAAAGGVVGGTEIEDRGSGILRRRLADERCDGERNEDDRKDYRTHRTEALAFLSCVSVLHPIDLEGEASLDAFEKCANCRSGVE